MNTLVFFMSMLSPKSGPTIYNAGGLSVTGTQTNEAAAKYIISILAEKGEILDRIIAITSPEARDGALSVFSEGMRAFCGGKYTMPELITVDTYSGENELSDEAVLSNVMGYITSEDLVYLDVSGGKRTHADMMLLLMKLVKYKGIRLADAVYSAKNGDTGEISSHNAFYRNLDILDGVNQFAVTGKATQLSACFGSFGEGSSVRRLLDVIEEFSDSITLCSTSSLDDILNRMKPLIKEVSEAPFTGMEDFLFRQLIPVISSKFFGTGDEPDYCHIILWCLENHLIQQAVTIYVEKMPKYILDKGLIAVTDQLRTEVSANHTKQEELNLEKELFFSRLMSAEGLSEDDKGAKELIDELKAALRSGVPYNGGNERVLKAVKTIMAFRKRCINEGDCRRGIKSLLSGGNSKELRAIAEQLDGKGITCKPYGLPKYLADNEPVLRAALGLPAAKGKSADETIEKKVRTIESVMTMPIPEGFTLNISREELRQMMLGYLYARGIRNRINHAADKNNSTARMEELLLRNGIDTAFRESVIIGQLKRSVKYISGIIPHSSEDKRNSC